MKNKIDLTNKKMGIYINGIPHPRLYWRKGKNVKTPSVLIKCGDCDNKVEIYYGYSPKEKRHKLTREDPGMEINGVFAPARFWRVLFKKLGIL